MMSPVMQAQILWMIHAWEVVTIIHPSQTAPPVFESTAQTYVHAEEEGSSCSFPLHLFLSLKLRFFSCFCQSSFSMLHMLQMCTVLGTPRERITKVEWQQADASDNISKGIWV